MIRCNRYELIFDVQSIQLLLYSKTFLTKKTNRTKHLLQSLKDQSNDLSTVELLFTEMI